MRGSVFDRALTKSLESDHDVWRAIIQGEIAPPPGWGSHDAQEAVRSFANEISAVDDPIVIPVFLKVANYSRTILKFGRVGFIHTLEFLETPPDELYEYQAASALLKLRFFVQKYGLAWFTPEDLSRMTGVVSRYLEIGPSDFRPFEFRPYLSYLIFAMQLGSLLEDEQLDRQIAVLAAADETTLLARGIDSSDIPDIRAGGRSMQFGGKLLPTLNQCIVTDPDCM